MVEIIFFRIFGNQKIIVFSNCFTNMKLKERLHNIQHVIDCQKSELISHQQLMVLYTVTIIIIGVLSFAVCGLTGAYSSYNTVINICILLFAVITFPLFLLGYIQCRTALYILSAVMSIFVSIEMIFSLFYPCCFENRDTLITSDIGILNLLAFILVSSYMLKAAILLTACAMTTYTACIIRRNLKSFIKKISLLKPRNNASLKNWDLTKSRLPLWFICPTKALRIRNATRQRTISWRAFRLKPVID